MPFNLLDLHDSAEDSNVRKLLRIYSVIPRFDAKATAEQAEQGLKINQFLKRVNEKLKKEVGVTWKVNWIKSTGYFFSKRTYSDWFLGKASIPLVVLKQLSTFGLNEEVRELILNSTFFCSTTGKVFTISNEVTPNLAYLTGSILGDGHIKKNEDMVRFEVSEKWLAVKFAEKVKQVFNHDVSLRIRIDRGKIRHGVNVNNKPAVRLFTKFLEIPRGKKSDIIQVPGPIFLSSNEIKRAFLEGVFDTDGGKRNDGFGLSTASKKFRDGIKLLLEGRGIKVYNDEWVNRKYNKRYYGLYFYKKSPNLDFICTGKEVVKPSRLRGLIL